MFSEFARVIVEKLSNVNLVTLGLLFLTALGSAVVAYWRTVEHK
ncbi:sterol desaturase family protein, partial [Mesorhizobium sp. M5C.F.Ca.IN.020.32.2.1]